jgi:SAM-dependent methyltransferase
MTFSKEWDDRYSENTHMSNWPWSDLVSYVKRYTDIQSDSNVLELGCGSGANIPFFLSLNANYHGIDGSPTIIEKLKQKFPQLKNNLSVCDFTLELPYDKTFDLVVDRAALTCNTTDGIKNCLDLIFDKLSPNGLFIGIDWYSTSYFEFNNGKNAGDKFSKTGFGDGNFANTGIVHFSNKAHLEDLLEKFNIKILEHKIIKNFMNNKEDDFASWNFIAQKKI